MNENDYVNASEKCVYGKLSYEKLFTVKFYLKRYGNNNIFQQFKLFISRSAKNYIAGESGDGFR